LPVALGKGLLRILQARGLKGCILTGLMKSYHLPSTLAPLWTAMPCVVTVVRTEDPRLPFACADHHAVAQLALSTSPRAMLIEPTWIDGSTLPEGS
jgi:LacI family transcriptional regulator